MSLPFKRSLRWVFFTLSVYRSAARQSRNLFRLPTDAAAFFRPNLLPDDAA